jgi:carboxyl-terminal processing protease
MKIPGYLVIILCVILYKSGYSQSNTPGRAVVKLNKEIFTTLKNNSMFSNKMDWRSIEDESKTLLSLATNDSTSQQVLYNFYTEKLRAAGDKHSFFISGKRMKQIAEAPAVERPQGDYLGGGVAWIKVPRCLSFDETKDAHFADTIRRIIEKLDTENTIAGWIVDLRHNTGGNMWPMLAGLNAMIVDGTAGYFVFGNMEKKRPWRNENGKISGKAANISTYKIKNNSVKIAVLLDARTGSSGEMAAVSLMGLPNVKSFGQTSAGYTTANYTFNLSNGSQLQLARTYVADRTGKGYPENIKPDVFIDDLSNTRNDRVIAAAKAWLLEK